MKIKAILVDLDDTLSVTKKYYDEALDVCHEVFNSITKLNYSIEHFKKLYMSARDETHALVPSSAAAHNRAIYFQKLIENLEIDTDFDLIYQLYHTYYSYVYNNMNLYPGAEELLKWFKDTKRTVVIVSDGSAHVRIEKIHTLGISKYVDYLVSSEEVGVDKPNNQPYLVALNKAGVSKEEAIYIGNAIKTDIFGGERLNMITVQVLVEGYTSKEEDPVKPDYVVKDLLKIKKIIEKLEK